MLGITSELSDHEPLLQKHFFSVLSAAWRNPSHSSHRDNVFSQNGFYSSQKLFACSINLENSLGRKPEKLEFSNLHQCGKLVAAALERSCKTDDRLLNQREERLVEQERLDLCLEIQGDGNEASSVVDVSILGPDPPPSFKMCAEERGHFKSASALVETQFR